MVDTGDEYRVEESLRLRESGPGIEVVALVIGSLTVPPPPASTPDQAAPPATVDHSASAVESENKTPAVARRKFVPKGRAAAVPPSDHCADDGNAAAQSDADREN